MFQIFLIEILNKIYLEIKQFMLKVNNIQIIIYYLFNKKLVNYVIKHKNKDLLKLFVVIKFVGHAFIILQNKEEMQNVQFVISFIGF